MSDGDRTHGERITSLEDVAQERKEDIATWRTAVEKRFDGVEKRFDGADKKLDELLRNGKKAISLDTLGRAFTTHVSSCPSRNSPNPSPKDSNGGWADQLLRGWKGLGVMGSILTLNGMLTVVILKLTGVF